MAVKTSMLPFTINNLLRRYLPLSSVLSNFNKPNSCNLLGIQTAIIPSRNFAYDSLIDDGDKRIEPKIRPKNKPSCPKITLQIDDSTIVTELEKAMKIAKRRGLFLVKLTDPTEKNDRATYKLTANSGCIEEQSETKKVLVSNNVESLKSEKLISISAKIANHDLRLKIKTINKLLDKRHTVKIFVSHEGGREVTVHKFIEQHTKEHGSLNTITRSSNTVMLLTPLCKSVSNNLNSKNPSLVCMENEKVEPK